MSNATGSFRVNAAKILTEERFEQGLGKLMRPSIGISSFQQFGTYQCVIYDPERMESAVYSNKTNTDDLCKEKYIQGIFHRK